MSALDTIMRALSTGGMSLIGEKDEEATPHDEVECLLEKHLQEHHAAFRALGDNGRNHCLCCGQLAEYYGTGWIGTNGSGDCSREVCVPCLESGCRGRDGQGCFGSNLAHPAGESHIHCQHDKK